MSLMKKTSRQASLYMLFQGLGIGVSFISFPIMTRIFSVQEYGDLALVNATVAILVAVAKCGLTTSFVRHYAKERSTADLRLLYSTALSGGILASLAVVLVYLIVITVSRAHIDSYLVNIFLVAGVLIVVRSLDNLFNAFLRAEERVATLSVLSLLYRAGSIAAGLIMCLLIIKGLYGYFVGIVLFEALMIVSIGLFFYRDTLAGIFAPSKELLLKLSLYGLPLVFFETSSLIHDYADRFLIKYFLDSAQVGIYSVGYNVSMYAQTLITSPLWMAIFPIYTKLWESSGKKDTERFLSGLLKYYFCVAIGVIFLASALSGELITALATSKFAEASKLIPFIVTGVMIHGTYHIIGSGYFLTTQTRKIMIYALISAAVNIGLNLYCIPAYGIMGAAITTLISYLVLTALIVMNSRDMLTIAWPWRESVAYLIFAVGMIGAIHVVHAEIPLVDLAMKLVIGSLVYTGCVLAYDVDIRRITLSAIRGLRSTEP